MLKRKKPLLTLLTDEIRVSAEEGITYEALLFEFKEYSMNSVKSTISKVCSENNIKRVPYRRSGDGNLLFRYFFLPPKPFVIR